MLVKCSSQLGTSLAESVFDMLLSLAYVLFIYVFVCLLEEKGDTTSVYYFYFTVILDFYFYDKTYCFIAASRGL